MLLVVANGGPGGMQVQVGLLARGLADAGCEVAVACGPGDLDVGDVDAACGSPRSPSDPRAAFARRAARADRATSRPTSCTATGCASPRSSLAAARAVRSSRATASTRSACEADRRDRAASPAFRSRRAARARAGCSPRPASQARVLDNAVPADAPGRGRAALLVERFGARSDAPLLAVSPARLSPQKDPRHARPRARPGATASRASCIGGGPLEPRCATRSRGSVLARPRRGRRRGSSDARAVLAGADVLALARSWEGQPTVVLEAMAAGVAIVATDCTGTADTVVDGSSRHCSRSPGDAASLGAAFARAARPCAPRCGCAGSARATSRATSSASSSPRTSPPTSGVARAAAGPRARGPSVERSTTRVQSATWIEYAA